LNPFSVRLEFVTRETDELDTTLLEFGSEFGSFTQFLQTGRRTTENELGWTTKLRNRIPKTYSSANGSETAIATKK